MKNQSTQIKKVVFGLIIALGTQAFAKNNLISVETLRKNQLDDQTIQELINQRILLMTRIDGQFSLNIKKVDDVVQTSDNQEMKEFVLWLKSVVEDSTDVTPQKPGGMTISSQDGGNVK
jgi:hypothetical protein